MKKYAPLFLMFSIISVFTHAQITAEFSYDSVTCGNEISVTDISSGETVMTRAWYKNDELLTSDGPETYTFSIGEINIVDTVSVSLVVEGTTTSDSVAHDVVCSEIPQANAGIDTLFCGLTGELDAELSIGTSTGQWSYLSGNIDFYNGSDPNSTVESSVYTENNPNYDYFTFEWIEDNYGCTDTDEIQVRFARIPLADVTIIPPRCFGEPASIKANEDYHLQYDWELDGGIVDSIWPPISDTTGEYRHLIHWPIISEDYTVHNIGLQIQSQFGCWSSINDTVVFEPGVPGYEMEIFPDSCLLGKGGVTFVPDNSMTGFRWIDTAGLNMEDPSDTIQRNIPAGTYRISQVYQTLNQDYITFYEQV
ncbi:MAG: hypothetical protein PF590_06485, partial [Candidatus Delongbacteria bacterium]|nr:hypothetical protein [Candidatus Delongbacteria bacterium]